MKPSKGFKVAHDKDGAPIDVMSAPPGTDRALSRDEHAELIARTVKITKAEALARLDRIEADPELRQALSEVRLGDHVVVTDIRRGEGGTIEVGVMPRPNDGRARGALAQLMEAGRAQDRMRMAVAQFELQRCFGRAHTALPFLRALNLG